MAHMRWCSCSTPRKPSGWDGGGDKTHQAPGRLSCLDLGRAQNEAQPSLRLCGVTQNLNLSGLDLGSAHNPGPTLDSSPAE